VPETPAFDLGRHCILYLKKELLVSPLWAIDLLRRFSQIASDFHFLDFATIIFIQCKVVSLESPPPGRARSLYVCHPHDRVAQLYPQAPGRHFVALHDSYVYGGGILSPHGAYTEKRPENEWPLMSQSEDISGAHSSLI
jgi:hypothetical protein